GRHNNRQQQCCRTIRNSGERLSHEIPVLDFQESVRARGPAAHLRRLRRQCDWVRELTLDSLNDGVDGPLRHLRPKLLSVRNTTEWEPSMGEVTTIGLDLAKHVFQVHGVDAEGATVLRKQLRRAQVLAFFSRLPRCVVGLEACATAHYWARELGALGHEVRLMPAQYVKAYIK